MVVISYGTLRDFFEQHADAKDALNNWYRLVNQADWANYHEIRFVGTHKAYDKIDCATI